MRRKPSKSNNRRGGGNNRYRADNNGAKIKSVSANRDKYLNLARDAMAAGDRVESENYLQHAEHYFRVLSVLQEEDARYKAERQQQQEQQQEQQASAHSDSEEEAPQPKSNSNAEPASTKAKPSEVKAAAASKPAAELAEAC